MSKDTREEGEIIFDGDALVADVIAGLRNSARLTATQKVTVERTVRRIIELRLAAIGANETALKHARTEFGALRATLINIGETVGSKTWGAVQNVIWRVLSKALEVAL